MTKIKCEICEQHIDRSACGQDRGVFTLIEDDGDHTKTTRKQLCSSCAHKVNVFIADQALHFVLVRTNPLRKGEKE